MGGVLQRPVQEQEGRGPKAVVSRSERLEKLKGICQNCRQCSLCTSRTNLVFGDGTSEAWLLCIGEAPGAEEDKTGIPFVGRSGQLLRKMLTSIGLSKDKDYYIANILKDRPPGNRVPESEEIDSCIKFLKKQIEIISPSVILLLGRTAVRGLLPDFANHPVDKMRALSKDLVTVTYQNIPVVVTYHPSALLRDPSKKINAVSDFRFVEGIARNREHCNKVLLWTPEESLHSFM